MKKYYLLVSVMLVLLPLTGYSKEAPEWRSWPMGNRLLVNASWFRPNLDTQVGISSSAGDLGALINFESTLGLADSKSTFLGGVMWRISKRNSLALDYFNLDRSSSTFSGVTIQIGDEIFEPDLDLPIASFFNIEATNLLYSFSAIRNPKHELALGVGVSLQDISFGVSQTENCALPPCDRKSETFTSTAPLPTLNVRYQFAINDKWILLGNLGWFAVSADLDSNENLSGEVWNVNAGVRWKAWKNVGFRLIYNYFDLDIEYEENNTKAKALYKYYGPQLGIDAYF